MPETPSAWVLYDDHCGFCRRWVPFWKNTLARRGIGIAPLQSEWALVRLGLSPDEASQDLRLIDDLGRRWQGADVYRYAMRRIGWARPLAVLVDLPLFREAFDWGDRTFARNRYRVSKACGLHGSSSR
jgi:predicted DCC family thiol-disulfide oxidoreductase YuxK